MFVFEENQVLNVFSISMSDRQFKNRNNCRNPILLKHSNQHTLCFIALICLLMKCFSLYFGGRVLKNYGQVTDSSTRQH